MTYTGEQLLKLWEDSGLSQRQLATELGMNFNILHGRIFRAQKSEGKLTKGDRVEMNDKGNQREYISNGSRIKTLEQLIEACEIDLDSWIIERHIINKWEVGAKVTEKDLEWKDGIIDGHVKSSGHLIVEPLFQVKVWLTNKNPEPVTPVITPVSLKLKKFKPPKPYASDHGRALVLADMHFGFLKNVHDGSLTSFHDRDALAVTLSLIKHVKPDIIVIVGDILDLAEWSDKFVRSPDMYNTTQPAIVEAAWFLGQIRQMLPEAPIYLLEGNHEKRLTTVINKQVPYAFGLRGAHDGMPVLSVSNLLGLEGLGVAYIGDYPNGEVWLADNLRAVHGATVRAKPGATAGAILDDAQATTIFGHVHRSEMASKTLYGIHGARTVSAFSPGCLCRVDGTVPGVKARNNWQQGIGVVDFNERFVAPTSIPIEQGAAMFGGLTFTGQDYLEQLKADTGFAF
jgi:hypothetical protein